MPQNFDIIIIGAGSGGLSAAVTALKKNKKVLLIEKRNIPGGIASGFVRGRFEFDTALYEFNSFGAHENQGELRKFFETYNIANEIQWVELNEAFRLISLDNEIDLAMPSDIWKFRGKLLEYDSHAENSLNIFFRLAEECANAEKYINECYGKPDIQYIKKNFTGYLKIANYSLNKVLKSIRMPKRIIEILSAYWMYLGASTENIRFSHYASLLINYLKRRPYLPKCKSYEISLAFEKKIKELGGKILYNTKVEKITTEKNKITGIVTDRGEKYYAPHVISNISPNSVYGNLLDKTDEADIKKIESKNLAAQGFSVFLGLNRSAKDLKIGNYNYIFYEYADPQKSYNCTSELLNNKTMCVKCPNVVIPDYSPDGTCVLVINTLFSGDDWKEVKVSDYYKIKNKIAENLIDVFERKLNVSIKEHIEEIEIVTPITYINYLNSPNGSVYGYLSGQWDGVLEDMSYDKESEIEGLRFCCGNSTRQSHYGYSYLSGYRAALLSLMDDMNSENSSISPQERLKLLDINTEKITNNGFGFGEWR